MPIKEVIGAVRSLLSIIERQRARRVYLMPAQAVVDETTLWLSLFSTVRGFLNDKDIIGTIGAGGVSPMKVKTDLAVAERIARYYQQLASRGISQDQYEKYQRFTDRLTMTIEDTLTTIERDQPAVRTLQPQQQASWYVKAAASLLFAITAYGGFNSAPLYAQEGPATKSGQGIEKTVETKDEKNGKKDERDYVAEFKKSLEAVKLVDGKDASFYNNRGALFLSRGKLDEAAKNLYKSIDSDVKFEPSYGTLGTVYVEKAKTTRDATEKGAYCDEAISIFNKGIALVSESKLSEQDKRKAYSMYYAGIAFAQINKGQKDEAMKSLNKASEYAPLSSEASQLLNSLKR